ncbi:LysR family transcriptional regulator [Lichenibacterium dinghuense]|uniref:LysR family transcriptional regulator n=1 Tax=Lichenibacterium dinghuense TaxID=2895977 RepID=UPI001F2FCAA0|nr:LysR family transcriptional regulator [Lichenibacterium sp. 6Y81]
MQDLDGRHADEMAAFLAVAGSLSFVGAGGRLGRHPTVISKRVAAFERRLGVRLIERTTRTVRLTEAGARLAERLTAAGALVREAEQEVSAGATAVQGRLRIAFPESMGRMWLAPRLPTFLRRHPALEVEAFYSERYVDLVAEGFDAAVRIGVLKDSRLIARRLGRLRRILGASPEYVRRHGEPATPLELADHNCLEFTRLASYPEWRLSDGVRTEVVVARGSLRSNDSGALLDAARAGTGILGAGEWLMVRDFTAGTLVPILPGWTFDVDGGVYLVRPSLRLAPARTEAFAAWLGEQFRHGMPWDDVGAH